MITGKNRWFYTLFVTLLGTALVFANSLLLLLSLIPILVVFLGLIFDNPKDMDFSRGYERKTFWLGNNVQIAIEGIVKKGIGPVIIFDKLPETTELVDGSNFKVFWKGLKTKNFTMSYTVRFPKRGSYLFGKIKWESFHPLGLKAPLTGEADKEFNLEVNPKRLNIRRIRGLKGMGIMPFPKEDLARMGPTTTDFKEIREYLPGDPVKDINWKATVKSSVGKTLKPMVNVYEVEGKKAVFLFIDSSTTMEVGTTINNAFEYGIEAGNSLAYFFLERGYRVGLCTYNGKVGEGDIFFPDTGKRQFYRISKGMSRLETGDGTDGGGFLIAVERCKKYLLNLSPLTIIVTRLNPDSMDTIEKGIKKILSVKGRGKGMPVMVVAVLPYGLIPYKDNYGAKASLLLNAKEKAGAMRLRRLGVHVMEWDPSFENFSNKLLRQVRRV